eukprot:COSAG05_NODE_3271_length_2186_cov_459.916188_3_plen_84_part_00
MELLDMKGARKTQACILALGNGEIRIYNEKHLVSTVQTKGEIHALRYGKFGRCVPCLPYTRTTRHSTQRESARERPFARVCVL